MSKGINIKVKRTAIIQALQDKLTDMVNAQTYYENQLEVFEQEEKIWRNEVNKIALAKCSKMELTTDNTTVRPYYGTDDTLVEFQIRLTPNELPEEPVRPTAPFAASGYGKHYIGSYDDRVADVKNAIRILQLSEEDVVSTSTYANVVKYL